MMSDSLDSRKNDRKALFDLPLPMRKVHKEVPRSSGDDSGNEGTATPPSQNTMAFSLMTKKSGRQQVRRHSAVLQKGPLNFIQTRNIEMPSDSQFAIAMRNQQAAERAEQQRIKNLVLNYDLQDSNADQAATGSDDSHFDPFMNPNPNHPRTSRTSSPAILNPMGTQENVLAYSTASQGTADKHPHNAALNQHAALHGGSARSADRSASNRSGQRARKLQLSDVDWYGKHYRA